MKNILLESNIDYALSSKVDKLFLLENKLLPIKSQELSIVIASSLDVEDTREEKIILSKLIDIFKKPIKFIKAKEQHILQELHHIEFKCEIFKLAKLSLENIQKKSENSYIIQFMNRLFAFSITSNASDIHFETLYDSIIIRLRIDGELTQIFRFDIDLYPLLSSIIKYFGDLDIAQRRIPLNGRLTRNINHKLYDMRISTLPTVHGESIVLRILDNGNINKDIDSIGFEVNNLNLIKKAIHLTQGLVLVTGPTGSGKTTTLYSMLNCVNTKNKKIITIEDPVEYKLDGVMQVNINNEINLNYQEVLKNILRQDPDILLIGEIRDSESLQIAMQASLTGHLVIATLHTNSAIETLTRLLDLNAPSYLIAATLKTIVSQRLLRVLCPICKVEEKKSSYFRVEKGCQKCNYTGYIKRVVVAEVLDIDEALSFMIGGNTTIQKIQQYIDEKGYKTIKNHAMNLVVNGTTTLEEYYSKV